MKDIYTYILDHGILSEKHRNELKSRRGFTDETIDRNRYFSGGQYLTQLDAQLIDKFKEDDLLASGVMVKTNGVLTMASIMLDERVIIPYLDKESNAYLLRPHKLGLKNVPVEIYQERDIDRTIIITEGEFKAAAAVQLGIPAIAIPGIGSFSANHFDRLVRTLNAFSVKDVCFIFDNEVKDDPNYANLYKEKPASRYDVQYYAHLMAEMLRKEGFRTQIGVIPDGWRVDGKADLDGALALGKGVDDFRAIIKAAKTDKEFFKALPEEAQKVIKRKRAKRFFRSNIKVEFGKYYAPRKFGDIEEYVPISNFTIRITATHRTPAGVVRDVVFTNEFGESTRPFAMDPADMANADTFKTFCLGKGNYLWRGRKDDLDNIWQEQFLDDDGRTITEHDHVGWIDSEKMWMFGNCAFKDGKQMRPDDSGIFWTDKVGIRPTALSISSGKSAISEGIPNLSVSTYDDMELLARLSDTIGDVEARICLGWFAAVLFLEHAFSMYRCFPFLFITGRKGSGKSTVAEWLMNLYGLETGGRQAADTTPVAMQRYLAYYSSLPVFIDEYRNTKQITYKNGFLRNCYNRQAAGKGIKADFGVREAKIRGTLLITGEETPEDNALLSRCVCVNVTKKRRSENHFKWFMANRSKMSNWTYKIMRSFTEKVEIFKEKMEKSKTLFSMHEIDDRTAINYAIVSGGLSTVYGDQSVDFYRKFANSIQHVQEEQEQEHIVQQFLDDLVFLRTRGLMPKKEYLDVSDGKIFFYFKGAYTIWSQEYRKSRGVESFKESSVRDYLKEESGYIDNAVEHRFDGLKKRSMVFDEHAAPEQLRSLVEDFKND